MNTHSIVALVMPAVLLYWIVGRPYSFIFPILYDGEDCWDEDGDGKIFMEDGDEIMGIKLEWRKFTRMEWCEDGDSIFYHVTL